MKRIVGLFLVGAISVFPFEVANAKETITQIVKNAPSKIVCEVAARDGSSKSYVIFHLMGFNEDGELRYRGITANQVEIRMTSDGKLLSDRTPCLSELVVFH